MKLTVRAILLCALCLIFTPAAFAQKSTVKIAGAYDNITVGQDSGDLEGMHVFLLEGGGAYYGVVQIASGGAELPAPALVKAKVKGTSINFTVPKAYGPDSEPETFMGTVTAVALKLKNSGGDSFSLKRKN